MILFRSQLNMLIHFVTKQLMKAREGVIMEWPLNGQFHNARDIILTSRNDVRGFPSDDNDDVQTLLAVKCRHF